MRAEGKLAIRPKADINPIPYLKLDIPTMAVDVCLHSVWAFSRRCWSLECTACLVVIMESAASMQDVPGIYCGKVGGGLP